MFFIVSLLAMACIWGFVFARRAGVVPGFLEIFIFLLILITAVYGLVVQLRKEKDRKMGFPEEDELSTQVKYKAGYFTFMVSIYVWLFLFLFKDLFTDHDTLFGMGVLLPAVIFMATRSYLSRNYSEDSH
jgi:hypothetical protein